MHTDAAPTLADRYDVVIVGGRPAGAGLAARLAGSGMSVLVIDRARFPSLPAVPSCAILYPQAMALLDEIGVGPEQYAEPADHCRRFILAVDGRFAAEFRMIEAHGRDFVCGIDRARFDHALWRRLEALDGVSALEATALLALLRDGEGRVRGVRIRTSDGAEREVEAGCVVGADGRFSPVARMAGAAVREQFPRSSTVHFATWSGVRPFDEDAQTAVSVYTTARGVDVLFFPAADGHTHVCTHVRADRARSGDSTEDAYLATMAAIAEVGRRMEGAVRRTPIVGLKRVANGYREPGGQGWALVGDAVHHKDPIDGQGIYDALLTGRLLAEELGAWHAGEKGWDEALAAYDARLTQATRPMYEATTARIDRELYDEPPAVVMSTVMRWMLTDPVYQRRFLEYLCRVVEPNGWLTPSLVAGTVVRGIGRDLRGLAGA